MALTIRVDNDPTGWICLVGATGTGKTAAALALAEDFPITVINADSRQVYRDLPIVTAQPSPGEQARCPHRLYGFLDLQESVSAGRFARLARLEMEACQKKGRVPLLVGGTGLYLRALAGGLAPIPEIPGKIRERVLRECAETGPEVLHSRLAGVDPVYAARIHPRDRQRITRALEVHAATGRSFSWWHAKQGFRNMASLRIVGLRLPRPKLHQRLDQRIETMLGMGAVQEIKRAWVKCPDPDAPGFSGIGCRELLDFLRGETTLEQARDRWLCRTRAYAKRQETWFNNLQDVHWLTPGDDQGLAGWLHEVLRNQQV
ncbi:MAG TPA: tRNA (adenosine(37)-N6)-dimethylallyltransferase MiaA [Desulfonatronum sp.]|nr:tRNA (adenosine(37)-N6)-dimethylallyltransferase MiaA [Desulfonatronum sp.]